MWPFKKGPQWFESGRRYLANVQYFKAKRLDALKKRIRNLETIVALEPSNRLLELGNEPDVKDLDSFDERLVNQLAQLKKRTR